MSWLENQTEFGSLRDQFLKDPYKAWQFQEQNRFFSENIEDLKNAAKHVDDLVKKCELYENELYQVAVNQNTISVQTVFVIYRNDEYVYFGRSTTLTILGLGGRFKDGKIEFYDQYRDKLI